MTIAEPSSREPEPRRAVTGRRETQVPPEAGRLRGPTRNRKTPLWVLEPYKGRQMTRAEAKRLWKKNNPVKLAAQQKAYYESHKGVISEQQRAYREEHKQEISVRTSAYRHARKESRALKSRAYYQAHKEERRLYRMTHLEITRASAKRHSARKRGAMISDFTDAQWLAMQNAYGHCCAYCKEQRKHSLTQDHIIPLSKGGNHTAQNIVPACLSCNTSKQAQSVEEFTLRKGICFSSP
jgi:5-methylcytosine-specific restriction endonuclease McrA